MHIPAQMPDGFERGLEKIKKGQNAIITLQARILKSTFYSAFIR